MVLNHVLNVVHDATTESCSLECERYSVRFIVFRSNISYGCLSSSKPFIVSKLSNLLHCLASSFAFERDYIRHLRRLRLLHLYLLFYFEEYTNSKKCQTFKLHVNESRRCNIVNEDCFVLEKRAYLVKIALNMQLNHLSNFLSVLNVYIRYN